MLFWGSSKKLQVCQSSATVIKVIGFMKVGSGSEVVEAIVGGPKMKQFCQVRGPSLK